MGKSIPLSGSNLVALVDDEDYELVMASGPWSAHPSRRTTYAKRHTRRKTGTSWTVQQLHTFLTGWPMVDHADCDGLNNQRSNLRPATRRPNGGNRRKSPNCRSPYKGVSWSGGSRPWRAQIYAGGKSAHLGYFSTQEGAARAYDAAAIATWGEYARPNLPGLDGHE